jgi:hypothetical protein
MRLDNSEWEKDRIMIRKWTLSAVAFALAVGVSGCELGVTNLNDADRARALASPDDVESLIGSTYATMYDILMDYHNFGASSSVMANHGSSAWGNFGMNDAGREPREPLKNASSYAYSYIFEEPWQNGYNALGAANDGLRALEAGLEIGPGGERNARAEAFAKFAQGIAGCYLAMVFDRAFAIDETTVIEDVVFADAVPYDQMMTFALGKLSEAESLAGSTGLALEDPWINGNPLAPADFVALIRTYKARCASNVARSPSEASLVNWGQVAADAAGGIQALIIEGLENDPWYAGLKIYHGSEEATWTRMHIDFAGMGNTDGSYQAWLQIPVTQRTAPSIGCNGACMPIPDDRWPGGGAAPADGDVSSAIHARMGTPYHGYVDNVNGRAERGTYRQSGYHNMFWDQLVDDDQGPAPETWEAEHDLLRAEAALEMNDVATFTSMINKTRVGNGGLPALVDFGTVPGGADCVPRKRFDVSGTCGDGRDALVWEYFNEMHSVSAGLSYFYARRHGVLPTGTAVQYPMPAAEVEAIFPPLGDGNIYTFGGGGAGSAPNIVPGDLNNALERAAWALDFLDRVRQRKALERPNRDPSRVH